MVSARDQKKSPKILNVFQMRIYLNEQGQGITGQDFIFLVFPCWDITLKFISMTCIGGLI